MKAVIGIDPGYEGALVFFDLKKGPLFIKMPIFKTGTQKEINFGVLNELFENWGYQEIHVFLERAVPFAMGTKSAFNYGRGFAALEIAIRLSGLPCTYVEPGKWTKIMHAGISGALKPKVKSEIAVKRLYPKLVPSIPQSRNGKLHEGVVDALLIAGYGMRQL